MDYAKELARQIQRGEAERRARIERRLSSSRFLSEPFRRLNYDGTEAWAWENYRATVLGIVQACRNEARDPVRMLEVGGGRAPLFTPAEAAAAGIAVTVNDVDARELSLGPAEFGKARFDIAGEISLTMQGAFDAPSGVAMAFHPTLYAPPFLINLILPDSLTAPLLRLFFPVRHDGGYPKFPAWYDMCRSNPAAIDPILKACGFRETLIAPFWGHSYFQSMPGLREIDAAVQRIAEARDWRGLTTYAYTLARR